MNVLQLGIGSYTLAWSVGVPGYPAPAAPLDAVGLIRIAEANGIAVVQIADNLPLHRMEEAEWERIASAGRTCGIALEIGTRGTDPGHLLRYLGIAERLRSAIVRTLITTDDMAQAERDLAAVLPRFAAAGIVLAVENHGLHTCGQLAALFRHFDSPYLGLCLDTVNSFGALESPDRVIAALAPYTVNVHIKDFAVRRLDHQMGFEVVGAAAGAGRLDIPGLLHTLHELGKRPNAILELWTPFVRSVAETVRLEREWMKASLAYLKQLPDFLVY